MLRADDIACYFLALQGPGESGEPITNLKLQKLCYYAQGYSLAMLGKPLFFEDIEHWQQGPVVPTLWRKYRSHGSNPIPSPSEPLSISLYNFETKSLLDKVYQLNGHFSAWELRNKTHSEPPWLKTPDGCAITHQALRVYFKALVDSIPRSDEPSQGERSDPVALNDQMARDARFREITERGLTDIEEGRYATLQDMRRRLSDV